METHDPQSNPILNSSSSSINPYDLLKVVYNPQDDSLTRLLQLPITPPSTNVDRSYFKDIPLNTQNKTWIRLFRSSTGKQYHSLDMKKLPLIIYFHAGGFILRSAATTIHHEFCMSMANHLPVLIASVGYRLAPENRLPAAYDDAVEALVWIKNQALDTVDGDSWLRDYVDFSNCFIMGCSSGGNIAYHLSLRSLELNLEPVKVSGLILNQPYFGGLERTGSELRSIGDKVLSFAKTDVMWELALPHGANRDHVYCNPMAEDATILKKLKDGRLIKWKCLVTGFSGDLLIDRQIQFVKMLEKESNIKVSSLMKDGGYHLVAHFDSKIAEELFDVMREIFYSSGK